MQYGGYAIGLHNEKALPISNLGKGIKMVSSTSNYLLGDVDGNGEIDAQDAVMTLKYVAHNITLTDEQLLVANTNKDKTVDAGDAVQILKYVAHNITEF